MSFNKTTHYRFQETLPQRVRDVLGRLKVSLHQNIYEADFEYGPQPLRWEQLYGGAASITAVPSSGGVRMRVTSALGDYTIRQSRPYHRYQPGKTMFMATALNLGIALSGNVQRVGFFDDSNGAFFEQSQPTAVNPYGMNVVVRADINGSIYEHRVSLDQWNGDPNLIPLIDFTRIQMFWIEYAWYGAGAVRFGFYLDGEPFIAHQIGFGNLGLNLGTLSSQQTPWARTGNLPVRYEQRNLSGTTQTNDMYHYGVSVIVEGRTDEQRGFTYSYGLPNTVQTRMIPASSTRFPLLTVRGRQLGTQEYGTVYASSTGANITSFLPNNSSFWGTVSSTTLTLNATTSGVVSVGQQLLAPGLPWGTYIVSGSGTTWTLSQNSNITANTSFLGNSVVLQFAGTPFTADQYKGRMIFFPNQGTGGNNIVGRILTHTTSTMYIADPVTGGNLVTVPSVIAQQTPTMTGTAGNYTFTVGSTTGLSTGMSVTNGTYFTPGTLVTNVNPSTSTITVNQPLLANPSGQTGTFQIGYCIGLLNRGQLLPKRLMVSSDNRCVIELISGSIITPITYGGAYPNFVPLNTLGSNYSFAERDSTANVITSGGEVVFAFTLAAGSGLQDIDLSYFFPMYNSIRGTQIDTLTLAVTTTTSLANVGGHLICQEAMS
jgi:hypothetical protein